MDNSTQPNLTRAHIIALIGTHARTLAHLIAHARTGQTHPTDTPNIVHTASLPYEDTQITARDTPLLHARAIWHAVLDLGAGGRAQDLPPSLR